MQPAVSARIAAGHCPGRNSTTAVSCVLAADSLMLFPCAQVHMSEHLIECGLTLFKYLRQLQTQACCEGRFPMQVSRQRSGRVGGGWG